MSAQPMAEDMGDEFITVHTADHVTTVTINRPERMNALHLHAV